jgi:hypothetical protein
MFIEACHFSVAQHSAEVVVLCFICRHSLEAGSCSAGQVI